MPTASEILAKRIDRVENLPDRFIAKIGASQQELYNELMVILGRLGLDDGTLVLNEANLLRIDALINEYYEVLRTGKYGEMVAGYVREFDVQKGISDQYNAVKFGLTTAVPSAELVFQNHKNRAVEMLLGDDFKTNFIYKIRDEVISGVEGRATFKELRSNLLQVFTEDERLPLMQSYVSQVSGDIFSLADRGYNSEVANDLGLVFGQYYGGLIKDSRKFCVEHDGQFYHIKELQGFASQDWQGKYRRTTRENIVQWMGGYNCKHIFAFTSAIDVPKTVIERNIQNGNYKPSEVEKEMLGL